jgi:PAS domain S-box-containing protein
MSQPALALPGELKPKESADPTRSAHEHTRGWPGLRAWLIERLRTLLRALEHVETRGVNMHTRPHSEAAFRQLAHTLSDVFWIYEPHCARFSYVSPAYERDWMRNAEALYADASEWLAPVHEADRSLVQASFERLAAGEAYAIEYRATSPSGSVRWIYETAVRGADVAGQRLHFAGVSHDITARKNAEFALHRSNRRKDEFLTILSHELRNPLQPIRTAAALLALQQHNAPQVDKAIAVIARQVEHMSRLIEDVLDVSRISHGKIRLRSERVRLGDVIEAAIEANQPLIEANRLHLHLNAPPNALWLHGDAVRLTQLFSNLLHNAAKFSDAGGTVAIDVQASERDERFTVSIRDQGIGIAPDQIGSVFELFAQVKHPLARDFGGLGIGLSVVRSLVELHGGQVSVRSGGAGKGSEFVVTLPWVSVPLAAAESVSAPLEMEDRGAADESPAASDQGGPGTAPCRTDRAFIGKARRHESPRPA